ncbi:MAG: aldehyde dehydrogenase [Flavobacteriales bacterium]|nr:aldehyde dehydrogenase [Flavobacteriales bacterium]
MYSDKILNFVANRFEEPQSRTFIPFFNAATGEALGQVADSNAEDVARAIEAARKAYPTWSTLSAGRRAEYLENLARLIEQRAEDLALAETTNTGKPLWLSRRTDIPRAAANFRFFAQAASQFFSECHPMPGMAVNFTLRQPLGVVGCISPWNLPLYLLTWKIAPALAAGNTVVAKPSELTPLTARLLCDLVLEVGLPPGVLNIVHGRGVPCGEAIVQRPEVKAVSFTGSTVVGRRIARICAEQLKKVSLELGGKNPHIIFDDVDIEEAVAAVVESGFTNQGQICLCGSRVLVQSSIYETFRDRLVEHANRLQVGDPLEEVHFMGAVVSQAHLEKIESYVALAQQEGGRVLCGGHRLQPEGRCRNGWFFAPTVIEGLRPEARCNQEEIFGPVITLLSFKEEEEAIRLANFTEYGLAAVVRTRDVGRALRVSERLQAGIVWVNCWMLRDLRTPFGGVKHSGLGREGGFEALRFFTEAKNVCIRYA